MGLTGGFGSGKSTVAALLRAPFVRIIDADAIARQLLVPGSTVYERLVRAFGGDILGPAGRIDRARLAERAFSCPGALLKLNRLMHPEIISVIKRQIRGAGKKIVILDAPLLIEAGLHRITDLLIVVTADLETQVTRLMRTRRLTRSQIMKRIKSQMPLARKVRLADFVIDNSGSRKDTKAQVAQIRRLLWRSWTSGT